MGSIRKPRDRNFQCCTRSWRKSQTIIKTALRYSKRGWSVQLKSHYGISTINAPSNACEFNPHSPFVFTFTIPGIITLYLRMLMLRTLQEKTTSRPIAAVWFPTGDTKIEFVFIDSETFILTDLTTDLFWFNERKLGHFVEFSLIVFNY